MAEPIGYATLQIIPSLKGVSEEINKQLGGQISVTGKRAGAQFGKGVADGLKASESDVKRAFDAHAKMADKAADATGKLKVAQAGYDDLIKKGIQSGQRYERAKAAVEKATRDETRSIKEATAALRQYEDTAKSAAKSGEKAGSGFLSGLGTAVSGAGSRGSDAASSFAEGFAGSSALLRLGSAGGPIGLALAAAGVVGGGLLARNIMAGLEREPLRDKIQAQLGIDEASMGRIGTAASAAFANNFGASSEEALDAARRAVQGGLIDPAATEAQMRPVIEQLTSLSGLIDSDLTTTTRAASVLLRSGLAASATEAFDIIAAGYTKLGGDLGGDFLDSIGEYSSGWKNAGLTAEQALALINQSVSLGVDNTDRGADALREFGRRVSEEGPKIVAVLDNIGLNGEATFDKFKQGGPAAFEAFDQVFDTIRAIEEPVRRNQAAMALLGDTAGDFIGSFAQWDPSKAVADFGSIEGAAQKASDTIGNNVVGSFESAKRTIGVAVDKIQDDLAAAFGPGLKQLADNVVAHKDQITAAFGAVAESVTTASLSVVDDIGLTLQAFSRLIGGVGNIQGAVLKFQAVQADFRGDHALADELRKESEEAFGWGESLYKSGEELRKTAEKGNAFIDRLKKIGEETKDAGKGTSGLGDDVSRLGTNADTTGGKLDALRDKIAGMPAGSAGWFGPPASAQPPSGASSSGFNWDAVAQAESSGNWQNDNTGGHMTSSGAPRGGLQITDGTWKAYGGEEYAPTANLASKEQQIAVAERIAWGGYKGKQPQGLGAWEAITKGMVPGITANTPRPAAAPPAYTPLTPEQLTNPALTPPVAAPATGGNLPAVDAALLGRVPAGKYGRDQGDDLTQGLGDCSSAIEDLVNILDNRPTAGASMYTGNEAEWLTARGFLPGVGGPGDFRVGFNAGHTQATLPGGTPFNWGSAEAAARGGIGGTGADDPAFTSHFYRPGSSSLSALGGAAHSATGPMSSPIDMSRLSGAGAPMNAFGPGYDPGIGTPGYNEYGEPGYWRTDPKAIRNAQRAQEDSQQAIADADQRIVDARQQRADLEKEITTTAEQRLKADKDILTAERAAARTRQDAQDAQENLAEAQKGRFTEAQKAAKSSSSKGFGGLPSLTNFSGIGGALGEFAGGQIGSALETFGIGDSPPWLQAIGGLMGGISIGGSGGDSVSPLSALGGGGAAATLSGAHGGTGQQPGPAGGVTYNINNTTGNDDLITLLRRREQELGAMLGRF